MNYKLIPRFFLMIMSAFPTLSYGNWVIDDIFELKMQQDKSVIVNNTANFRHSLILDNFAIHTGDLQFQIIDKDKTYNKDQFKEMISLGYDSPWSEIDKGHIFDFCFLSYDQQFKRILKYCSLEIRNKIFISKLSLKPRFLEATLKDYLILENLSGHLVKLEKNKKTSFKSFNFEQNHKVFQFFINELGFISKSFAEEGPMVIDRIIQPVPTNQNESAPVRNNNSVIFNRNVTVDGAIDVNVVADSDSLAATEAASGRIIEQATTNVNAILDQIQGMNYEAMGSDLANGFMPTLLNHLENGLPSIVSGVMDEVLQPRRLFLAAAATTLGAAAGSGMASVLSNGISGIIRLIQNSSVRSLWRNYADTREHFANLMNQAYQAEELLNSLIQSLEIYKNIHEQDNSLNLRDALIGIEANVIDLERYKDRCQESLSSLQLAQINQSIRDFQTIIEGLNQFQNSRGSIQDVCRQLRTLRTQFLLLDFQIEQERLRILGDRNKFMKGVRRMIAHTNRQRKRANGLSMVEYRARARNSNSYGQYFALRMRAIANRFENGQQLSQRELADEARSICRQSNESFAIAVLENTFLDFCDTLVLQQLNARNFNSQELYQQISNRMRDLTNEFYISGDAATVNSDLMRDAVLWLEDLERQSNCYANLQRNARTDDLSVAGQCETQSSFSGVFSILHDHQRLQELAPFCNLFNN